MTKYFWLWLCALLGLALPVGAGENTKNMLTASPHGVCAHVSRWEFPRAEDEFKLMKAAGIDWVRTDMDWNMLEKQPGQWDYSRWDSLYKDAEACRMGILPILAYDVKWARPIREHQKEWLNYVEKVVSRYGDRMSHVEVWNEEAAPYFPTGKDYAEFLRVTAAKVRGLKPHINVVFGGVAGVDIPYIEDALKAGAADSFDVMNVHHYNWTGIPEERQRAKLLELKALMKKYNLGKRPIWLTECGISTAKGRDFLKVLLPVLLEELGMAPERTTAVLFEDSFYHARADYYVPGAVAGLKTVKTISFNQLKHLKPSPDTLLILSETEAFPAEAIPDLLKYVKEGGRLLAPGGLPLYYEQIRQRDGRCGKDQVGSKYMKDFHIGWEAFWTHKGVPDGVDRFEYEPRYSDALKRLPYMPDFRFLNTANLKGNDRFVPVLYGTRKDYRGALAGVYHFDSDFKGKIAISTILSRSNEMTTVGRQAELLPRTLLAAYSAGADKISWYNFRSNEWNQTREADFGIVRENLAPKPAYAAMRTFNAMYPTGSSKPAYFNQGTFYRADWVRPDGKGVYAFWIAAPFKSASFEKPREVCFRIGGNLEQVVDYLGNAVPFQSKNGICRLTVGPGILYLVGPDRVEPQL